MSREPRRIRAVVADDSLTVRRRIVEILGTDPEIEVVGEAATGRDAHALCARLRPDVLTLDLSMPTMSGVEATRHIMADCPTPILIVSSSVNRGEVFKTYDALAAGAVDALDKSEASEADAQWERKLIRSVKLVSRIKVVTRPNGRSGGLGGRELAAVANPRAFRTQPPAPELIAIGASTGGPAAIQSIVGALPGTFDVPILFVIHIGEPFGAVFAQWLDGHSAVPVTCAVDREPLPRPGRGRIIVAPPHRHLVVERGLVRLSAAPERHSCRPSVDVLFESVAAEMRERAVGCLLTGMGRDGAAGLLRMKLAGAETIAQDEQSSVVFGMPKEAITLGGASRVLALGAIGPELVKLAKQGGALPAMAPAGRRRA